MSCTNEGYKYILNYQDHLTKFVILKPLKSKTSSEVNQVILDIFTTLGAPEILQCDNGREFSTIKTDLLEKYWPHCKLITSRPRHPQSQGSVERANGDVMNILRSWLSRNSSSSWVDGLKFVQLQKNNSYNRTINCSPYKATFGREMPVVFNENESKGPDSNNNNNNDDDDDDNSLIVDDDLLPSLDDNFLIDDELLPSLGDDENNILSANFLRGNCINDSASNNATNSLVGNCGHDNVDDSDNFLLGNYDNDNDNDEDDDDNVLPRNSGNDNKKEKILLDDNNNDDDDDDDFRCVPSCSSHDDIQTNVSSIYSIRKKISQKMSKKDDNVVKVHEKEIVVGTPVLLKIPKIDCHKLGFPNILGIIYKYFPNINKYKIKTQHGIVDRLFSTNDFDVCPNLNVNFNIDDTEEDKSEKSLRQLARLDSMKHVGCQCYGKCLNNKCFCFKNKRSCGNLCKHKTNRGCLNKNYKRENNLRSKRKHLDDSVRDVLGDRVCKVCLTRVRIPQNVYKSCKKKKEIK